MATYPDLPLENESTRTPLNMSALNVTGSGSIRIRNFQATELFEFNVLHRYITQTQAESVYDMWSAGKTDSHSFTWKKDSTAYTVYFKSPPVINQVRGTLWECQATLVGSET